MGIRRLLYIFQLLAGFTGAYCLKANPSRFLRAMTAVSKQTAPIKSQQTLVLWRLLATDANDKKLHEKRKKSEKATASSGPDILTDITCAWMPGNIWHSQYEGVVHGVSAHFPSNHLRNSSSTQDGHRSTSSGSSCGTDLLDPVFGSDSSCE